MVENVIQISQAAAIVLNKQTIKHSMTVRHEPRPPAPRPSRLMIAWTMQDGQEWKEYINLTGQMSTTMTPPQFIRGGYPNMMPPVSVRYEFGYEDGRPW